MIKRSLGEHEINIASLRKYLNVEQKDTRRKIMKNFIDAAIKIELTEKQRYCIIEHYINNKCMSDIATETGVCTSTVSFHIKQGIKKIKKRIDYIKI